MRSLYSRPSTHHWVLPNSSCMTTAGSHSMPCSCCMKLFTPKVPSTPMPLPPRTSWPSRVMTLAPSWAACTEAARPETPQPTTTTPQSMISETAPLSMATPAGLTYSASGAAAASSAMAPRTEGMAMPAEAAMAPPARAEPATKLRRDTLTCMAFSFSYCNLMRMLMHLRRRPRVPLTRPTVAPRFAAARRDKLVIWTRRAVHQKVITVVELAFQERCRVDPPQGHAPRRLRALGQIMGGRVYCTSARIARGSV